MTLTTNLFGCLCGWALATACARSAARWLGGKWSDALASRPLQEGHQLSRFVEELCSLVVHCVMGCWGLHLIPGAWWRDTSAVWTTPPPSEEALQTFMRHQLCSWSVVGVLCVMVDERRKDFRQMVLHHVITILLVLGSWCVDEIRIGVLIVTLHDLSDIPASLTKVCNYLKLHGRKCWYATEACFALNLACWYLMRLHLFANYVVPEADAHITREGAFCWTQLWGTALPPQAYDVVAKRILVTKLYVLVAMHWLWFLMMVRIAVRLVGGGDAEKVGNEEYENPKRV